MSSLLGGNSHQSNTSNSQTSIYNQAYPGISSSLGGSVTNGANASDLVSQLLGGTGGNQAYQNYQNSTGFQNQLNTGTKAITNNAATSGLLNSGATLKALNSYGTGLAQQNFGNYLSSLLGLSQNGVSAAGVIGNTGGVSNSTSTGTGTSNSKTGLGL